MALEDADKKEIGEMISGSMKDVLEAIKSGQKGKPGGDGGDGSGGDDDSKNKKILEEARELQKQQEEKRRSDDAIAAAVKFNSGLDTLVKDNVELFGGEHAKIVLGLLATRTKSESDVVRANEYRAALLDIWLEQKDNVDILPESLKSKADQYLGLTEVAKRERSAEFWEIVDVGLDKQKGIAKARELAIAREKGQETTFVVPKGIWVPKDKEEDKK